MLKCPICNLKMQSAFIRKGSHRQKIGYYCTNCEELRKYGFNGLKKITITKNGERTENV